MKSTYLPYHPNPPMEFDSQSTGRCLCGRGIWDERRKYCSVECSRTAKRVREKERYRTKKLITHMEAACLFIEKDQGPAALDYLQARVSEMRIELSNSKNT